MVDINPRQIARWNDSDDLPIFEPGLREVIDQVRGKNLFFTTDLDRAIIQSQIIFVSVNTPTKKHGVGAGRAADLKVRQDFSSPEFCAFDVLFSLS